MSNINISFNNKDYSIDPLVLAIVAQQLKQYLLNTISGTGAVVNFGGVSYNVDPVKLQNATNDFISGIENISGSGTKIVINGVEYSVDSNKLSAAVTEIHSVLGDLNSDGEDEEDVLNIEWNSLAVLGNPSIDAGDGMVLVKVSDTIIQEEEFNNSGIIVSIQDEVVKLNFVVTQTVMPGLIMAMYAYDSFQYFVFSVSITGEIPDIGIVINETGTYALDASAFLGDANFILKDFSNMPALDAPTEVVIQDIGYNRIIISPIDGCEYSIDGNSWTDNPNFYDLAPETEYTIYVRYKATVTHNASESVTTTVRTKHKEVAVTKNILRNAGYYTDDTTDLIIPSVYYDNNNTPCHVTSIGDYAFEDCTNLTSVIIPDGVTTIGYSAFSKCSNLNRVTIGDGVTSIGSLAFNRCSGLISINIPESVTNIGNYAFRNCSSLTSITIPDGVTSIGDGAFQECISLTNITIPSGVTNIDYGTFWGCISLKSIIIPESVTNIDNYAFADCTGLTSITIPDSVTSIGNGAFENCTGLTRVYISDIVKWCGISFANNYSNPLCYARNLYLNDQLVTELVIPDSVTSIGDYAFDSYTNLTSITIPDSVTSIGDYAFDDCTGLTSITIPSSVTSIGYYAFSGCNNLRDVYITDVVAWLNISAGSVGSRPNKFGTLHIMDAVGNEVTELVIPNSVTSIRDEAFSNCSSLTSITIPNGVTSIGYSVFSGCTELTSITIPDSVTSIGRYAFYNCAVLPSITIPNSVTSIGDEAFRNCSGLKSITIPNSVTSIGRYAFSWCTSLTSITIPDSVISIGMSTFSHCTSLTEITIPDSVISIGISAFHNCSRLTSITIPDSVTSIGESAFYGCGGLTDIYFTGTTAQWGSINKGIAWKNSVPATHVRCSDGDVAL